MRKILQPCPRHDHPVVELVYHPNGRGISYLADGTALHCREGTVAQHVGVSEDSAALIG